VFRTTKYTCAWLTGRRISRFSQEKIAEEEMERRSDGVRHQDQHGYPILYLATHSHKGCILDAGSHTGARFCPPVEFT